MQRTIDRNSFYDMVSSNLTLIVILISSAVIRVMHVVSLKRLPLFDDLIIDSKMYDQWANTIAAGNWLGDRVFYMDPLYPYFLASVYSIFGHDLLVVRIFQTGMGVAICALVAFIGRRVGGNFVGNIAALLIALYQPLVFEGGEIEKTILGILLVTASLACAIHASTVSICASGAFLALAALCRGNLILIAPFGAIYFLFNDTLSMATKNNGGTTNWLRQHILGKSGLHAFCFILSFVLMLSPVLLRNHFVSGEWVLTTSQLGANFYTGNNPSNVTGAYELVPFVRPLPEFEEHDFRAQAEKLTGKKLSAHEVSAFWLNKAVEHLVENPWFAVKVFTRKIFLVTSNYEVPDGWSMYFIKKYSPALRTACLTFGVLMSFAVLGFIVSQRNKCNRLLSGYIVLYALSLIAFFVFSRYRIYIVPPMAVFSAFGMKWLLDKIHAQQRYALTCGSLAVAASWIFAVYGSSAFITYSVGTEYGYAHLAELYVNKGDFVSAKGLLVEALQQEPLAASALCSMGSLHLRENDPRTALGYLEKCSRVNAKYPNCQYMLGFAYERLGQRELAVKHYSRQLEFIPGHQLAKKRLLTPMVSGIAPDNL